jgi:hypothetical protein
MEGPRDAEITVPGSTPFGGSETNLHASITAPQKATSLSNARNLGLDPIRFAVAIALLLAEPSVCITSRRHLLCVSVEDFLQAAAST